MLVLGCALVFADVSLHQGSRASVLVVAEPLQAGQVLTAGDVRSVRVGTASGLSLVLAREEGTVVGRPVAVPLVAGEILSPSELGAPSPVTAGLDVVAAALKPGSYPPDLRAGDRVQIVPVALPSSSVAASRPVPVTAVVLGVDAGPADGGSGTVFSLQVTSADADMVAVLAAAGQVSLVQLGAGG